MDFKMPNASWEVTATQDAEQDTLDLECPVCYEPFTGAERTLSCGHVFCHDCLVRTLVTGIGGRYITRDNIICPVCRHVTFITKGQPLVNTAKACDSGQTLEIPVCHPTGGSRFAFGVHRTNGHSASRTTQPTFGGLRGTLERARWGLTGCSDPRLTSHDSQIFIISNQGRPMSDEDVINSNTMVVNDQNNLPRARARLCTTSHCLIALLLIVGLLALLTATLPWIFLA